MTFTLWLDCAGEARDHPCLALHTAREPVLDDAGRLVPVVSGDEFRRFLAAWNRNDPNGSWGGPDTLREGDGALIWAPPEDPDDRFVWPVVGVEGGKPVYELRGWAVWECDTTPFSST